MDSQIKDLLKAGIIEEARTGDFCSPCFMIPKKDPTKWRLIIDYREANRKLIKDDFPVPDIQAIFDTLGGAQYLSVLDLMAGYYQLSIEEKSRKFTAFKTRDNIWAWKRLPFGIACGPSGFIRMMGKVLAGLVYNGVLFYFDDVIIYSKSVSEHLLLIDQVCERMQKEGLTFSPEKCEFFSQNIEILGFQVTPSGRGVVDKKLEKVENYPIPKSKKEVKGFLGLSGYYRALIQNYAEIATPLTGLLKKDVRFEWTPQCGVSFESLKEKLTTKPIVAFPDWNLPFKVGSDASNRAIGGILSQVHEGKERVIYYYSKTLNDHEVNYSVWEKEALGVILSIRKFEKFLIGRKFTIEVDNTAITYLFKLKKPRGRLSRWVYYLQSFDYDIIYKPGSSHTNCDALSRMHDVSSVAAVTGVEVHEKNVEDHTNDTWSELILQPIDLAVKQKHDPFLAPIITWLIQGEDVVSPYACSFCKKFMLTQNEILLYWCKKDKVDPVRFVIPKECVGEILQMSHASSSGGHLGRNRLVKEISTRFWWKGMYQDIKNFVASCEVCARKKVMRSVRPVPMIPVKSGGPFEIIQADFVGPIVESQNKNKHLIVFTDTLTKWCEASAVPSVGAKQVAEQLFRLIISRFGLFRVFQTDRGAGFMSKVIMEVYRILDIKKMNSSSFHPCSQGKIESLNGSLVQIISRLIDGETDRWDDFIDAALFAYRTTCHDTTKETPFFCVYGRRALMPADIKYTVPKNITKSEEVNILKDLHTRIKIVQEQIKINIDNRQEQYKERYDRKTKERELEIGDEVYLKVGNVPKGKNKKFFDKYQGKYLIEEKTSDVNYRIDTRGKKIAPIVHIRSMWIGEEK